MVSQVGAVIREAHRFCHSLAPDLMYLVASVISSVKLPSSAIQATNLFCMPTINQALFVVLVIQY